MDSDGIESVEDLLMQMVVDAIEHMPAAKRDSTMTRMLAGEDSVEVELRGDCLTIGLLGEQIWSGSIHLVV